MDSSTELTLPAPAKLNLFLHIVGRRNDGYHELETLFQFLSISDELHFTLTNDGTISLTSGLTEVTTDDNLVYRAALLLLPHRQDTSLGVQITLDKKIPMGGGLGGGSSDAATTLLALNKLWQLKLTPQQLADIGLQLGADVPVFLFGRAALAQGIGENLYPAQPKESWYLVINPGVHVSTADIFQHPDLPRDSSRIKRQARHWLMYRNDCQQLVSTLYPPVAKALQWLLEYAPTRMTGTGACVFGCFENQAAAQKALAELPAEFSGFVAQGLNTSPAWQALHTG
ncbi:4-(cytidine 5'-diphospho)-2-C-methyl-D-erythritol kinase [Aliidiomarina sedimenti]|uniref:4-diphosphocytidyl-2-C-methyl-D-erythritol kinase n=1 Tax=Aliidiomarina sedimenti TaxID=1933879 RepID=A0ABY0C2Z8_9GAMM|nr:4-(cytidine 5'-diphospho)-2-C-methyl-D-erythritol kinase [Aliidiomarina sedimenti]RUO32124.1 4-(cytidine 5'-diphospho)-2-C-methyl-D-erythritol kinase [Aliidiomarina sedimenti]